MQTARTRFLQHLAAPWLFSVSRRTRFVVGLMFASVCLLVNQAHAELQFEGKPRWGFDGTIQLQQFNLLTVTVFNNSPDPWQGAVSFTPSNGIQSVDVAVRQDGLYIEPFGSRVLQFYVFFPYASDSKLEATPLGRRFPESTFDLDSPPKSSGPVTMRLISSDRAGRGGQTLAVDEQMFPGSAVVLQGVAGIALDHAPRFQEPQMQAFKDWLYAGGTLYLIPDSLGAYPEFSGSLSELNVPTDRSEFGGGVVLRMAPNDPLPVSPAPVQQTFENYLDNTTAETVFRNLRAITTPDHNWYLIYSMAILYLLILFPGCWLLGRKKGDFRLTYGVIVATVALFSFGFHTVGKRGYGESTTINTVVLAKAAQPGRWIVKQWSNFFVTNGGQYLIEHPVGASAYSSGQFNEAIRGIVVNQPDGKMVTEIPSFSNRTIFDSGIQKLAGLRPNAEILKVADGKLSEFKLTLPEGQKLPENLTGYAVFRNEVVNLQPKNGNELIVSQDNQIRNHLGLGTYISESTIRADATYQYGGFGYNNEKKTSATEYFDATLWPVIADDLGIRNANEVGNREIASDRIHVYLKAPLTEDFFATASGNTTPQQTGYVVYAIEYPVPAN